MANLFRNIFSMNDPGEKFLGTCKACYLNNITPANPQSKNTKGYKTLADIAIHCIKKRGEHDFAGFFQEGHYFVALWAAHLLLDYGKPDAELTQQALDVIRKYSDNPLAPIVADEEKAWLIEHEDFYSKKRDEKSTPSEADNPFEFPDHIKEYVRLNVKAGDDRSIEKVLEYLRHNNISQLPSIFLLTTEGGIPFSEANLYIQNSKTWNK